MSIEMEEEESRKRIFFGFFFFTPMLLLFMWKLSRHPVGRLFFFFPSLAGRDQDDLKGQNKRETEREGIEKKEKRELFLPSLSLSLSFIFKTAPSFA
jgi:hypothetical protein